MRVSINYTHQDSPTNMTRAAHLYLDAEELSGIKAVEFQGTLATGLVITDDGNPRRHQNAAVTDNGAQRVIRVPADYIGVQPEGRSRIPKGVSILEKSSTTILLDTVTFLPSEMLESRKAYSKKAKPTNGITSVMGYRTEDGEFFATAEEAQTHLHILSRRKVLEEFSGRVLERVSQFGETTMTLRFYDDVSLQIDCGTGKVEFIATFPDGDR